MLTHLRQTTIVVSDPLPFEAPTTYSVFLIGIVTAYRGQ